MAVRLKGKFEYMGPIGLIVTVLLGGVGFWLFERPEYSDLMAFITFVFAGALLLAVAIFTLYKPFRTLKRDIELIHGHIKKTADAAKKSNSVSWEQFSLLVLDLLSKILFQRYTPDLVIGVGRSGGIVATILAGCLESCPILGVDVDIDSKTKTLI